MPSSKTKLIFKISSSLGFSKKNFVAEIFRRNELIIIKTEFLSKCKQGLNYQEKHRMKAKQQTNDYQSDAKNNKNKPTTTNNHNKNQPTTTETNKQTTTHRMQQTQNKQQQQQPTTTETTTTTKTNQQQPTTARMNKQPQR